MRSVSPEFDRHLCAAIILMNYNGRVACALSSVEHQALGCNGHKNSTCVA